MRKDAVTPELRREVLLRDRRCFMAEVPGHACRDQWGGYHDATDLSRLTLDHVHDECGEMGKRAPSDARHLVALCGFMNVHGVSKSIRQRQREYLRRLYEEDVA